MKAKDVAKGKRVIYHSYVGAEGKPAVIISDEVRNICGTDCCFIDIITGCVDIDSLEEA
jgi:hypothetical protein